MPFVLDCSSDAKCRIVLVLGLRPSRAPFEICSRCNLALLNLRSGQRRWRSPSCTGVEVRSLRQSWRDKRGGDDRSGDCLLGHAARLLSKLPRLLRYLALLAQSQNKRHETDRGVFNTRAQGSNEIPNARSLL